MRFTPDGPSIPDDLLIARDLGDVIFFCGAGVSQHRAHLPNFTNLGRKVIEGLGSSLDSPPRRLLDKALEAGHMAGVGGLVATDRVFGLLEREFEVEEVRAVVAEALRPPEGYSVDAHRIMLDLATSPAGVTRLVTTNFDPLFEECHPALLSWGPPQLPDPRSDRDFRGVVHMHGRVDADYRRPRDDEFVLSSADFGRAYLSDGWATRFIQSLLARYLIVFVGYTADDPPMQYLLEALNLRAGSRARLYAFQAGDSGAAAALWEHRGVQAIPFDDRGGFDLLWDTLAAWARRARDVDGWYAALLDQARPGPAGVDAHVRGQIAHMASTREGARRIAAEKQPIDGSWLLAFDPKQRYAQLDGVDHPRDDGSQPSDPFDSLRLDSDPAPDPPPPPDDVFQERKVPDGAWDPFEPERYDHEDPGEAVFAPLRGQKAGASATLPPRLFSIGAWIQRVAHQPVTLWWAAGQDVLHPDVRHRITHSLRYEVERFPEAVRNGWSVLFAARSDERGNPDQVRYDIAHRAQRDGWSRSLVREYVAVYRPRLVVSRASSLRHPLLWTDGDMPETVVKADVDYPRPHQSLHLPDEQVAYAVSLFRANLELANSLSVEITGSDRIYLQTTRAEDGGPELSDNSYGLTGQIIILQKLLARLTQLDLAAAREEVRRWPASDEYVFARLRIWAAGNPVLTPDEAAQVFLELPDRVFWGSVHHRDLLYAVRDRWNELPEARRAEFEKRLLTGSFPWPDNVDGGVAKWAAYERMSLLHWLSSQGVAFSFDLAAEMKALQAAAPEWTERVGEHVADSMAPSVFSVEIDESPDLLIETPIPEILAKAHEVGRFDTAGRVQREPFSGLVKRRPVRALGALTHAARHGEAPYAAWSDFLRAETRVGDRPRMIRAIAGCLLRLPIERFRDVAYPVSDWMVAIAGRLYGDAADVLQPIWARMIVALPTAVEVGRPRHGGSWADVALNAPVGDLVKLLQKDPTINILERGAGFPRYWTERLTQLLHLPGDLRPQALVMLGHRVAWLFHVDPLWTQRELLPAGDKGDDSDAFWDGLFWAAHPLEPRLFALLKTGMIAQAHLPHARSSHGNVLAGILLSGWLTEDDADPPQKVMTDTDLREVLIHADDELRVQVLWHIERCVRTADCQWRDRIIPFFKDVWPKQRALRNPDVSPHLANLAFASGDLMPSVVEQILPRLVPVRNSSVHFSLLDADADEHPAKAHPKATLDVLWAVLAEDPRFWPYGVEGVLDQLARVDETSSDPRLSELRRRRQR